MAFSPGFARRIFFAGMALALAGFLPGCGDGSSPNSLKFKKTSRYSHQKLVYDTTSLKLGELSMLANVDSCLIIFNDDRYLALSFLDLRDGKVFGFGKADSMNSSLTMPLRISPVPGNPKEFEVFDFVKKKIFTYSVDSCRKYLDEVLPSKAVSVETSALKSLIFNDSTTLSVGLFGGETAFLVSDFEKNVKASFGNYNFNPEDSNEPMNKALAYQGLYAVQGDFFVQACKEAPIIQIFSLKDLQNIVPVVSIEDRYIDYISRNEEGYASAISSDNPTAYCDLAVSPEKIYLLYSGKKFSEFKEHPEKTDQCGEIHVLDWEGNLLEKMRLDIEVTNIALSPCGSRLYAITLSPVPALVFFSLSK